MRIFISTGEVSGDLQGGLLVEALYQEAKKLDISLEVEGLGGNKMEKAGAKIIAETTSIGSVGLWESVPFILPTWQVQQRAKSHLKDHLPDIVVLIDYVGPNLAIASYLKQQYPKLPIIWYIGPQFWVWTPLGGELKKLLTVTDKLLAIFPKEAEFYQNKGLNTTYVGHPLVYRMKKAPHRFTVREKFNITQEEKVIILLPASRRQELKYLLPVMVESAEKIKEKIPNARFYLPISLPQYRQEIKRIISNYDLEINLWEGETLEILSMADLAITKSGTVNLELALLKIPQIVIYKVNKLTMWIARKLLKFSISFMSPVNLITQREIVPELLQEKATAENILNLSLDLILNQNRQKTLDNDYQEMINIMSHDDNLVCEKVAKEIITFFQ